MATNKQKQNLRFKIVSQRIGKKIRYDGFTSREVEIIKSQKDLERYEKELGNFWTTAPRNSIGAVNWESMTENEIDLFEHINKQKEKAYKKVSKAEDEGYDIDKIMTLFMKLNINSASY
ncbi:hypothetical protein [Paenibacillus silvae]|uniref:Uncharacterized protein n=1 Tax=Paenibacillus silvae TaxID=1325358 RepID=A0A2W6NNM6_9BACL|nr:hypothetical protein [Paenibacillus silvae]PZT57469.1 hypothetical protein DN757_02090 [Paenibacillus silvae]